MTQAILVKLLIDNFLAIARFAKPSECCPLRKNPYICESVFASPFQINGSQLHTFYVYRPHWSWVVQSSFYNV
jgi:hypothetical protein